MENDGENLFEFLNSISIEYLSYRDLLTCYSIYLKEYPFLNEKKNKKNEIIWNNIEKEALIQGIQIFGINKWDKIYEKYKEIFLENNRTILDLKYK